MYVCFAEEEDDDEQEEEVEEEEESIGMSDSHLCGETPSSYYSGTLLIEAHKVFSTTSVAELDVPPARDPGSCACICYPLSINFT